MSPSSRSPIAPRRRLSVLVICHNEADRIAACLESVSGWADQLVVLDSGSSDDTAAIARRYTAEVHVTDWPGYGPQRQRALDLATGEYVLALDADERVTAALRAEIDHALALGRPGAAAYRIRWAPIFLGRRLRFGGRYSSPQGRLFRRAGAFYPPAQVHENVRFAPGAVVDLEARIEHDSFRDYRHAVEKHTHYAWLLAQEKHARGDRCGIWFAPLRSSFEFFLQYLVRGLVFDGARGFLLSILLSQYAYQKYAALWSLTASGAARDARFDPALRQLRGARVQAVERVAESAPVRAAAVPEWVL